MTMDTPNTVTQEDLDLLNGLRLGFLPILEMDRLSNRHTAETWASPFLQGQLANPAIVDEVDAVAYLQVFSDKLLILAVEVRRVTAILQTKLTLGQAASLKAAMSIEVSKRDMDRMEEVHRLRKEQAAKPKGSPLRLSPGEKVMKRMIETFPTMNRETIVLTCKAACAELTEDQIEKVWKALKG